MTRAVRLGCFLFSILGATTYAGCGESTTLEDNDSGATGVDTGSHGNDSGMITFGDSSVVQDTGMVSPFPDTGVPARDGGFMRPDANFMRPDAGTMGGNDSGTTTGVMCGTAVCGAAEVCCVTRGTGGMMISQTCTAPSACMGAALGCDGPEDCMTGQACCGSFTGGSAGAMCVASAMCMRGRFCHVTSECTGADMCCSFMGVNVCAPRCF